MMYTTIHFAKINRMIPFIRFIASNTFDFFKHIYKTVINMKCK